MKVGTENKNKTYAAIGLGVLALAMVVYRFFSPTGGAPPLPAANQPSSATTADARLTTASAAARTETRRTTGGGRSGTAKKIAPPPTLDPTLKLALLRSSEDTKYTGTGRNIFRAEVEIPKVVTPPVTPQVVQQAPPPPPPPAPFPLKFFGFASKPGEPKRIFLSSGEDVFIAAEGDIVDRRYKVLRITNSSVEIEDVLSNNRQSIPLTQG